MQAIGGKVGAGDRPPHLDLRPNGVTVRLVADDRSELTEGDLTLATEITAIARDLNFAANPADVQNVQIAIDTLVMADVLPFWQAVLGYDFVELTGDNLVDSKHIGPTVWFQQMDAPRPQRNRIHVDLYVPHDEAEASHRCGARRPAAASSTTVTHRVVDPRRPGRQRGRRGALAGFSTRRTRARAEPRGPQGWFHHNTQACRAYSSAVGGSPALEDRGMPWYPCT